MYANGEGVPQDYAEAVKWYRRAAEQGYAAAQYNLGAVYATARGVPQDYAEAVKWYRRARPLRGCGATRRLLEGVHPVHGVDLRFLLAPPPP